MSTRRLRKKAPPLRLSPSTKLKKPNKIKKPLLLLFLLSPIYAELISGATPLEGYLNPLGLVFQLLFYGSAAVLIRELSQRSKNKWIAVFILGLALAILEEGVMTKVFFNPASGVSPLVGYGRIGDLNLALALQLLLYHSLVSVAIPIGLTELIFPQFASRVWLNRIELGMTGLVLSLTTFIGATFVFTYAASTKDILACLGVIAILFVIAKRVGPNVSSQLKQINKKVLFLGAFAYLTAIISAAFIMPALKISPNAISVFLIVTGILAAMSLRKIAMNEINKFTLIAGATATLLTLDLFLAANGRIEMILVAGLVTISLFKLSKRLA